MKIRSTLKDVASAAGVSPTTVSLYLNGSNQVCSDETATRIREAVKELRYARGLKVLSGTASSTLHSSAILERENTEDRQVPNAYFPARPTSVGGRVDTDPAAQMARPKTYAAARPSLGNARKLRTIGVALPSSPSSEVTELSHPAMQQYANQIWTGASEIAEWEEFRLLSFPRRLRTATSVDAFTDGSIGGVIMEAGFHDPRLLELIRFGLPIVVVNRFLDIPDGCGAVYPMVRDIVDVALNHLWEKGHRRIAHYGGPSLGTEETIQSSLVSDNTAISWVPSDFATLGDERFQSFMRQHHCLDPELCFSENSWDGIYADMVLEKWLSLDEPPTAVFCDSDSLALALWNAAEKRGLSIPTDLSILGVGDAPEYYRRNRPLTTVALPGAEVGREAVRLLLRMMEGIPADRCRLAVPLDRSFLIERGSVQPCN